MPEPVIGERIDPRTGKNKKYYSRKSLEADVNKYHDAKRKIAERINNKIGGPVVKTARRHVA